MKVNRRHTCIVCIRVIIFIFGTFISLVKLKGYGEKLSVKNMPLEGLLVNVFLSLSMILHLTKVNNC